MNANIAVIAFMILCGLLTIVFVIQDARNVKKYNQRKKQKYERYIRRTTDGKSPRINEHGKGGFQNGPPKTWH